MKPTEPRITAGDPFLVAAIMLALLTILWRSQRRRLFGSE